MALLAAVTKRGRNSFVYCSARYLWKQNSIIQNSPVKYYLKFCQYVSSRYLEKKGKNIPCKFFYIFYFYFLISELENNINATIKQTKFFLSLW